MVVSQEYCCPMRPVRGERRFRKSSEDEREEERKIYLSLLSFQKELGFRD